MSRDCPKGGHCTPEVAGATRSPQFEFDNKTGQHYERGVRWTSKCRKCGALMAWAVGEVDEATVKVRRERKRESKRDAAARQESLL